MLQMELLLCHKRTINKYLFVPPTTFFSPAHPDTAVEVIMLDSQEEEKRKTLKTKAAEKVIKNREKFKFSIYVKVPRWQKSRRKVSDLFRHIRSKVFLAFLTRASLNDLWPAGNFTERSKHVALGLGLGAEAERVRVPSRKQPNLYLKQESFRASRL